MSQTQNIYCVGRNYQEHIEELKNERPSSPVLFVKPLSSLCCNEPEISFQNYHEEIHYECELVLKIKRSGHNIKVEEAPGYIESIGLGIDFTDRKAQALEKKAQIPWTLGKCQKNFAYIGQFTNDFDLNDVKFQLAINSDIKQKGAIQDMIFSPLEIISFISNFTSLQQGDLVFTGTPSGVGPVRKKDHLVASLNGKENFNLRIK